ncbi:hypothetical protein F6X40_34705 [Paraburkholderia sp. UCT31]|uniref:hypothetical protein n=1 Tax=Paraburkholderia sp. UCT31 TaxID=2615209 RepID=UPI00165547BF|nr:hypothetical protein [Paraburkholderia sp. UCT31]MBC8741714.1 hypothetical protein [Paraburkholderia sp. UCT31]
MALTVDDLTGLLAELENADPVDYGDLPFGEPELRRLVMTALLERHTKLQGSGLSANDVNVTYMLTTGVLVLENLVLHARLLLLQGQRVDVQALLQKYAGK